jgi:DNA-binding NtrC family response regulator
MNPTPALVFGLEDDLDDQESIIEAFRDEQLFNYEFFADIAEFMHVIKQTPKARVVVLDYNLPGGTGQEVLDELKGLIPNLKATIISAIITNEMAVQLALSGAKDCVVKIKGWENKLAKIVKRHVEQAEIELETERLQEEEKNKANETVKTLLES